MKQKGKVLLIIILMLLLIGCVGLAVRLGQTAEAGSSPETAGEEEGENTTDSARTDTGDGAQKEGEEAAALLAAMESDYESRLDQESATRIELTQDGTVISGEGVSVSGNLITISQEGTYLLTGVLTEGKILVEADSQDEVILLLAGVDISNSEENAIEIQQAGNTVIWLEEGSENRIQSGTETEISVMGVSETEDSETEASNTDASGGAIYARDDLSLFGSGSLSVFGYLNNGIQTTNNLTIGSGTITVTALNHGLKGKDSVTIGGGEIQITAASDGIQSDDTTGEGYGVIIITGGTLQIESGKDGIQAETELLITGGDITLLTGGGTGNEAALLNDTGIDVGGTAGMGTGGRSENGRKAEPGQTEDNGVFGGQKGGGRGGFGGPGRMGGDPSDSNWDLEEEGTGSAKGLKCSGSIVITGGTFSIDAADDAIHANDLITISGGTFSLASADDGIHADTLLTLTGGRIVIRTSYEGLEANQIRISGGDIQITASDDGINANGGSTGWGFGASYAGTASDQEEQPLLLITGGSVSVNAGGDGLDSNGDLIIEGGTVVVEGPTDNGNGAIDSGSENEGECLVNGGTVLAIGSSNMAEGFDASSGQCSFLYYFSSTIPAGSELTVTNEAGEILYTFTTSKNITSIVFSSPLLTPGETVILQAGEESVEINVTQ